MDTITHSLMGLTIYGTINKEKMPKELKRSLFLSTMVASQIPDIDVVSKLWDTEGMYQMWHRGITHSIFMAPVWAILIYGICFLLWKRRDSVIFYAGFISVLIHVFFDALNTWGTGVLEPLSNMRASYGVIPIVDVTIWLLMLVGFLFTRFKRNQFKGFIIFRFVWLAIFLHVIVQATQGYLIYQSVRDNYEDVALAASFMPWNYQVVGKAGETIEISTANLWSQPKLVHSLQSAEDADLVLLFEQNPRARTLYQWSPFVVVVEDDERIGIYDPRFYRNGESFLFEYIEKSKLN